MTERAVSRAGMDPFAPMGGGPWIKVTRKASGTGSRRGGIGRGVGRGVGGGAGGDIGAGRGIGRGAGVAAKKQQQQRYYAEGRCFSCGKVGHKKVDCPNNKTGGKYPSGKEGKPSQKSATTTGPGAATTTGPDAATTTITTETSAGATVETPTPGTSKDASDTVQERGKKRGRTTESTGFTPAAKLFKFPRPNFAWSQQVLVVRQGDGTPLSQEASDDYEQRFVYGCFKAMQAGETPIRMDSWVRKSFGIMISTPTRQDANKVRVSLEKQGFLVQTEQEYRASFSPTTLYSGLIVGVGAGMFTAEMVNLVLSHFKKERQLNGRFEHVRSISTKNGNLIVEILADEKVSEAFEEQGCTLYMGSSLVQFTAKKSSVNRRRREARAARAAEVEKQLRKGQEWLAQELAALAEDEQEETEETAEAVEGLDLAPPEESQDNTMPRDIRGDAVPSVTYVVSASDGEQAKIRDEVTVPSATKTVTSEGDPEDMTT